MAIYFDTTKRRPRKWLKTAAIAIWIYITVNSLVLLWALPAMRRAPAGEEVTAALGPLPFFGVSKAAAEGGYDLVFQLRSGLLLWLVVCLGLAVGYSLFMKHRRLRPKPL